MQQKTRWIAICLAAGLCAGVAGATTIDTGTDNASWLTAISGTQTDTTLPTSSPWTTTDGFSFTAPNSTVRQTGLTGSNSGLTTNGAKLEITMPNGGETAILLNLGLFAGYYVDRSNTVNIELSDGEQFSSAGNFNPIFWFSSSGPITSITISSDIPNEQPFIASLSYATSILATSGTGGTTSPIPEPATFLLVAAGGLIFLGARRRWFRHQA
ncbi:MAG TPA: PEP-CTERM sorting domain-containing protein [Bryobacteraceae bacterium]